MYYYCRDCDESLGDQYLNHDRFMQCVQTEYTREGVPFHMLEHIGEDYLLRFKDESKIANAVCRRLSPHFIIEREVPGVHGPTGKRLRIDAIATPRDTTGWPEPSSFGIEFKGDDASPTEWGKHVAQALDYTFTEWEGYGRIPIMTCPSAFAKLSGPSGFDIPRYFGGMGIGELKCEKYQGLVFRKSDTRIWSETYGVSRVGIKMHIPVGSR